MFSITLFIRGPVDIRIYEKCLRTDSKHLVCLQSAFSKLVSYTFLIISPFTKNEDLGIYCLMILFWYFQEAMKRKAVGIWNCQRCKKTVAGGAWVYR